MEIKYGNFGIAIPDEDGDAIRDLIRNIVASGNYEWVRVRGLAPATDESDRDTPVVSSLLIGPGIPILLWDEPDTNSEDVALNDALRIRYGRP